MNPLDFSTYHTLEYITKRDRDVFMKANGIEYFDNVHYLFYMNYFISLRGHCYDADIAYLKKTESNKLPLFTVRRTLYYMKELGLVSYNLSEDLHPTLKRCYFITQKGYSVIDNYLSLTAKKERDLLYLLKKIHKEARDYKKKD